MRTLGGIILILVLLSLLLLTRRAPIDSGDGGALELAATRAEFNSRSAAAAGSSSEAEFYDAEKLVLTDPETAALNALSANVMHQSLEPAPPRAVESPLSTGDLLHAPVYSSHWCVGPGSDTAGNTQDTQQYGQHAQR
jgi:hypothetical protein